MTGKNSFSRLTAFGLMTLAALAPGALMAPAAFAQSQLISKAPTGGNFAFTSVSVSTGSAQSLPGVVNGPYELVTVTVQETAPDYIATPSGPQAEDAHALPPSLPFAFVRGNQSVPSVGVTATPTNAMALDPQVPNTLTSQPALTWTVTYAVPIPANLSHHKYTIEVGSPSGFPASTMVHWTANTTASYSATGLYVNAWSDSDDPIYGMAISGTFTLPAPSPSLDRDNPGKGNNGEPPNNDSGDNGKGNLGDPGNGQGNQNKGLDGTGK